MGRSLLLLVSGLTIITGLIQVNNSKRISEIPKLSTKFYNEEQARNMSKSLIDNAIETIKNDNDWIGSISLESVIDTLAIRGRSYYFRKWYAYGKIPLYMLNNYERRLLRKYYKLYWGSNKVFMDGKLDVYTQNSSDIPENSVTIWDEYRVLLKSTAIYDDTQVTTEVLMQRDSFSKYSYMTQSELSSEGNSLSFIPTDEIYGPVHTNGRFSMLGDPSFYGLITSPNMWRAYLGAPSNPNFYGGTNFNAPLKNEPTTNELGRIKESAKNGGLRFQNEINVTFYESNDVGYASISEKINDVWSDPVEYDLSKINGIISTSERVDVHGEVKGSITLHSESFIEIDGDITYHTNPLVDSTSTDMLGLVSEGEVQVDEKAHLFTGQKDLTIHASIMALNDSFSVEKYNVCCYRGKLNILGGIIQNNRGPVATGSIVKLNSGYSKNYQYDNRLKSSIPPSFPRENVFSIVYWKDEVTYLQD